MKLLQNYWKRFRIDILKLKIYKKLLKNFTFQLVDFVKLELKLLNHRKQLKK